MNFENSFLDSLPLGGEWGIVLKDIVVYGILAFGIYAILFYVLRFWLRNFKSDLPLVTLNASRGPVLTIFILFSLQIVFEDLGEAGIIPWIQKVLTALTILAGSYWIGQLLTKVFVYVLREFAEKSEAMWDDVVIPILETALPALVYIIGAFLALQAVGVDLTGLWVAFGGLTFVLGFAVQDILANFFSGLVLLIDTPFQFGDVILMDGSLALIKKVGIRLTELYLIDTHCQVYVPNGSFQRQDIVNLSRPTAHYYYTVNMTLKSEADPMRAANLMTEVVLGHPDTLGKIDAKLKYIDKYYEWEEFDEKTLSKREGGRQRLLAEKKANQKIEKVKQKLLDLQGKLKVLEKGGLDKEEVRNIQMTYIEIAKDVGLEVVGDREKKRTRTRLEEEEGRAREETVIAAIRNWYQLWLQDPNMLREDQYVLPQEWERKIELLKRKMNRLFQKFVKPEGDETRLDDYLESLLEWLNDRFKNEKAEWQEPKIRMEDISGSLTQFIVKYYVDDIKLEHCERGYRVNSEVRREMVRQLRKAYLYS